MDGTPLPKTPARPRLRRLCVVSMSDPTASDHVTIPPFSIKSSALTWTMLQTERRVFARRSPVSIAGHQSIWISTSEPCVAMTAHSQGWISIFTSNVGECTLFSQEFRHTFTNVRRNVFVFSQWVWTFCLLSSDTRDTVEWKIHQPKCSILPREQTKRRKR